MTFWEHLDELRRRLLWSLVAITVAAIAGFLLSDRALNFLIEPFRENVAGSLALLAPSDGFIVQIKMALVLGAVIASPIVAYELYGFIGVGLKSREKRWLWPVAMVATILFWGGVVFAWLIFPTAIRFLGSFAGFGVQNLWSLKNYISLVLFLHLAFGIIFQLPLVIGLLIASGLVPSSFFRRNRRYAIVTIFILAALATPTTDALTMMLMVGPLLLLYEVSIWVGVMIEGRRRRLAASTGEEIEA
ncbi:twin-arginine translocase subunit TatC [bacterium]|nr:twin-arginine translocase subunit TatC [bacterium]MBU1985445.1 twin-arginine translocase subunit TatC [bacterium]